MERLLQIGFPLAASIGAFFAMETCQWDTIRSEAMLVLSVLAGAVLFRLGRGIPAISIDHLEVEEAENLTRDYKVVSRRLAYVAAVTAVALVGLATIGVVHRYIAQNLPTDSGAVLAALATALLAFVIVFAFCRAVALVLGDLSSVAAQSDTIVNSVRRRRAREEEEALQKAERDKPFKKPTNYGDIVKRP